MKLLSIPLMVNEIDFHRIHVMALLRLSRGYNTKLREEWELERALAQGVGKWVGHLLTSPSGHTNIDEPVILLCVYDVLSHWVFWYDYLRDLHSPTPSCLVDTFAIYALSEIKIVKTTQGFDLTCMTCKIGNWRCTRPEEASRLVKLRGPE
jgi:hypothetical protein